MSEEVKEMTEKSEEKPTPKRRGRAPKYETSNPMPGRPPRSPKKKVGRPLRFLVTVGMEALTETVAKEEGLIVSDLLRLALYQYLEKWYKDRGEELPEEIRVDTTFDTLRGQGFV